MFQGLSQIASLLKTAQSMGPKLEAAREKLRHMKATGAAGGDMVVVEMNGLNEVTRVTIDPALFARGDVEMIQDLTVAAINLASQKAKELHMEAMQSLTDGVDLPGLQDMLSRMGPVA